MICPVVSFYNESTTLPRCLDSLKWCDRVYAIDGRFAGYGDHHERKAEMEGLSDDGSREICKAYDNVTLLDCPQTDVNNKISFGFKQFKDPVDVSWYMDSDCYVIGDTLKFREECRKKSPWNGVAGLRYYYKVWQRNKSCEGEYNFLYRLLNPYGVSVHKKYHGIYIKNDVKVLWPTFVIPCITIIHDDSQRTKKHAMYSTKYHNENGEREAQLMRSVGMPRPSLIYRIRHKANQILNPAKYPKPNPNLK